MRQLKIHKATEYRKDLLKERRILNRGLANRTINTLLRAGYYDIQPNGDVIVDFDKLSSTSLSRISHIPNLGERQLNDILKVLKEKQHIS